MEIKVASAQALDSITVMEVDSTSMREDTCEAAGGVPTIEEATTEASTPFASGEVFLCQSGTKRPMVGLLLPRV